MDRWTAFVATAHLRLRLDIFYHRVLQGDAMPEIKRPMELAGLKSRLLRAQRTEVAIGETGKSYDRVLDQIDELHSTSRSHLGELQAYKSDLAGTISRMVGGSNGGDPLSESDGQDSAGVKAPAADPVKPVAEPKGEPALGADAQTVTAAEVAPVPAAVTAPAAEPMASFQGAHEPG